MLRILWLMVITVLFVVVHECHAVDIRTMSATTTDSSKIRFTYEVVAGPLSSANVPVHIYRSANAVFEPASDVLVAKAKLQALATGEHSQEIVVPASGLAINPSQPFIFVVIDLPTTALPNGMIVESNEANNVAMFRKHTLAVIVHGLTFGDVPPEWVGLMSTALTANGYDAVVPADWAVISHEIRPGVPKEFGATLAADVLDQIDELQLGPQDRVDVHWIGQSRGAVVVSPVAGSN
jgi:predicted alpha/beta-fold hydrolase